MMSVSDARVDAVTVPGNIPDMRDKARQYLANTSNRKTEENWFAPKVFASAGEYLEHIKEAQPFFLLVDCFDPHEPWDPPKNYVDLYGDPDYSGREPTVPNYSDASWITEEELKRMRALYAGEVTMTDAWLGRFLERIEGLGLAETTLLILLSDHGACLGEHDATGKPYWALYPELTDIIFMMRHPRARERARGAILRLNPRRCPYDTLVAWHREAPADGGDGPLSDLRGRRSGPEARALYPWIQQLRVDAGRALRDVLDQHGERGEALRRE